MIKLIRKTWDLRLFKLSHICRWNRSTCSHETTILVRSSSRPMATPKGVVPRTWPGLQPQTCSHPRIGWLYKNNIKVLSHLSHPSVDHILLEWKKKVLMCDDIPKFGQTHLGVSQTWKRSLHKLFTFRELPSLDNFEVPSCWKKLKQLYVYSFRY